MYSYWAVTYAKSKYATVTNVTRPAKMDQVGTKYTSSLKI